MFSIKILNELFLLATMLDKYLEKRWFENELNSRQPLPMKIGEIILTTELQSAKGDR